MLNDYRIGDKLKAARKKKKLTQVDAAFQIGICESELRNIEHDRKHPPLPKLARMCDFYNIRIKNLFT